MAPSDAFTSKMNRLLGQAILRLRTRRATGMAIAKQSRREMATLLEQGDVKTARIRVENIIRADLRTELYEVLANLCDTLKTRINYLDLEPTTDEDMDKGVEEAIRSILFAAPRADIKDLTQARALLEAKFGAKSGLVVEAKTGKGVNEMVLLRLSTKPPSPRLVDQYLVAIAETYDVPYESLEPETVNESEEDVVAGEQEDPNIPGQQEDFQDVESKVSYGKKQENKDQDSSSDGEGGGLKEPPIIAEDLSEASPPQDLDGRLPLSIALPSPSTERPAPKLKGAEGVNIKSSPKPTMKKSTASTLKATPSKAAKADGGSKPDGKIPDVDDLLARFALLKK